MLLPRALVGCCLQADTHIASPLVTAHYRPSIILNQNQTRLVMTKLTTQDVLEFLIKKGPGRTEAELADAIFGAGGYPQRVHIDCARLVTGKSVRRRGAGGRADPFRYYPAGRGR
jgi:hypothetical protein